jgi:uncharacterized protein YndB with AHSA1/START domain
VTEIRLDVELAHPPERVWRAVTEPAALADWFLPAEVRPVVGHRFTIAPAASPVAHRVPVPAGSGPGLAVAPAPDAAGFDRPIRAEVTEVDPPRRLAMRWQAPELEARVTFTIVRVTGGCRLTLRQTGFFGMHGLLRRRVLHRTYAEMLGRRLPEALDRLATDDGRRGPGGAARARRLAQRARSGEVASRRNVARPYRVARRLRAVGRVRVSRPLHLEVTVPFAVPGRTVVDGAAPGRGHARGRGRAVGPAHSAGRRGASHRERRRPEWQLRLRGVALRAWDTILSRLRPVGRVVLYGGGVDADGAPIARRGRAVALAAALLLVVGLVTLIVAGATARHPAAPPQTGNPPEGDSGYAELPGRKRPTPTGSVSTTTRSSPSAISPPLGPPLASTSLTASPTPVSGPTAAYHTESLRLGGYRGQITLTNPGTAPVTGWTVVVTVPQVLALTLVRGATGAEYRQQGNTVTFTAKPDTRVVPPGGSVRFTFDVDGVSFPSACTVDGRPCSGITPT